MASHVLSLPSAHFFPERHGIFGHTQAKSLLSAPFRLARRDSRDPTSLLDTHVYITIPAAATTMLHLPRQRKGRPHPRAMRLKMHRLPPAVSESRKKRNPELILTTRTKLMPGRLLSHLHMIFHIPDEVTHIPNPPTTHYRPLLPPHHHHLHSLHYHR